jgi:hypothetical protein
MKHNLAKEIIAEMVISQKKYNELLLKIKTSSTDKDFDFYKKGFAQIMGTMLLDIVNPIVKEHPDLKPEELNEL